MKTNIIAIAATAILTLSACGGGTSSVNPSDCISEAEKQIPTEQHPVFGEVPSLARQNSKAIDIADSIISIERDAIGAKADNDNYEEISGKINELDAKLESIKKEISQSYEGRISEAAKGIIGKEIPVEANSGVYSAAKATIAAYKPGENGQGDIIVNASFTAARTLKSLAGKYTQITYNRLDASGKTIASGLQTLQQTFKSGDEVKLDSIILRAGTADDIAKMSFTDN